MKSNDFLSEDIASDAHEMHLDHEVQMARKDCYAAADDAIALHKLLRNVSEQQGLEGWVAAKITLASDYLNTVREHLEYQLMSQVQPGAMEFPVAEGAMPQSVIKSKQKYADMSDQEFYTAHKDKSEDDLKSMAWRHGYGKGSDHYVNRHKKGKPIAEDGSTISSAGSMATVNNPGGKPKSQVGSLFGGTYQRKKKTTGK